MASPQDMHGDEAYPPEDWRASQRFDEPSEKPTRAFYKLIHGLKEAWQDCVTKPTVQDHTSLKHHYGHNTSVLQKPTTFDLGIDHVQDEGEIVLLIHDIKKTWMDFQKLRDEHADLEDAYVNNLERCQEMEEELVAVRKELMASRKQLIVRGYEFDKIPKLIRKLFRADRYKLEKTKS